MSNTYYLSGTKTVSLENPDFSFLFIYYDKIYVYRQKFENRDYYEVDCNTGQIIKELGDDFFEINKLSELAATEKNFSQYLFPTPYDEELTSNNSIKKIVSNEIKDLEIVGDVEYTQFDNMLLMNYYERLIGKPLINKFRAFDLEKNKEIFNEVLSSNANAYVPDSFFVYKNLLILLIEKTGLKIYKLN